MSKKINLAVLIGGPSSENEVSHLSSEVILKKLNKVKYNIKPVTISKDLFWNFFENVNEYLENPKLKGNLTTGDALNKLSDLKIDASFIAMHGTFGEDGTIQALLESINIPYNGSGLEASALAMNKVKSSEIFSYHNLKTPPFIAFTLEEWNENKEKILESIHNKLNRPDLVIKPATLGSSVGTFIVNKTEKLEDFISKTFKYCEHLMVQEFVNGDEVTCGVLDFGSPSQIQVLPPTQIIPVSSGFFDYKAKYTKNASKEITPAKLPKEIIDNIQSVAIKAHEILGCSGITRSDIIVRGSELYLLETNTLPGMTEVSLIPQEAAAVGIEFSELLDKIISHSLNKK